MLHRPHQDGPPAWLVGMTLAVVGGAGSTLRLLYQEPAPVRLRRAAGPDPAPPPPGCAAWPAVSILVPARNEERNLPALLPSLLGQAYPADRFEVIVIDDQSTDRTPEILAEAARDHPQLRVVQGTPLPDGWKGKPWAMRQGAAVARGDWLLFTDADTVHAPESLASALYEAVTRRADLFTIAPTMILQGPAERLIMPIASLGIFTFYHPSLVNNPRSAVAIANGQYLLIRRSVYDALGGIDAVRADIAEDLEFGRLVKRKGYRLYLADGRGLMRVRMYHNLAEVWEGWRKNVLLSFLKEPVAGALQLSSLLLGLLPFGLCAYYGARAARPAATRRDRAGAALAGAQVGMLFWVKRRVDRALGLPFGWTFTFPLGLLLFIGILADSFRRLLSGQGVTWKGRAYTR
jgi:chlorobactene glucosyltransferase